MKLIDKAKRELIIKALELGQSYLTKIENEVLIAVFYDNKTFAEIGGERKLTKSRVTKIFNHALTRILKGLERTQQRINENILLVEKINVLEDMVSKSKVNDRHTKKLELINSLPEITQQILNTRITETDLSTRAKGSLKNGDIETVRELLEWEGRDLLRIRNTGKTTLKEIESFLQKHNLKWRMFDL